MDVGAYRPINALLWVSEADKNRAWALGVSKDRVWSIETCVCVAFDATTTEVVADDGDDCTDLYALIQSFWRLASQVVAAPERLPRARRREEVRLGSTREHVTILRLRRAATRPAADATAAPVDWQRRWLVRGHWRRQWYPSLGEHRQIWISPHVKGPADRPLVLTGRVVELVR